MAFVWKGGKKMNPEWRTHANSLHPHSQSESGRGIKRRIREAAYENPADCLHPNNERRDARDSRAWPVRTSRNRVLSPDERWETEIEADGAEIARRELSEGVRKAQFYNFNARWR